MLVRIRAPKRLAWGVLLLGLVLLALYLGPLAVWGQGTGPCLSIQPQDQEVLVGHSGAFQVRVDDIEDLYGVQLKVLYNPAILDVTAVITAGNVFDSMSGTGWTIVDETAGTIEHVFSLDSSEPQGFTGSGYILDVRFTAVQHGVSTVDLAEAILADSNSVSIDIDCPESQRSALVRGVLLLSTATPTPTITRTPTPTFTPCCIQPSPTPTIAPTMPTPEETPIVLIYPEAHYVLSGRESAVEIRIRNAPTLYAAWVRVRYDPDVIQILAAGSSGVLEEGDLFTGKEWYPFNNSTMPVSDKLTYGATLSFNAVPGPTGEVLARIHFRALDIGTTPIVIEQAILVNQQGASLPYDSYNGTVYVISLVPTSPTPSPTPAQSPTPTVTPTALPMPRTRLYLDPGASSLTLGDVRQIDVKVAEVTNLQGVEFHITYDPTILAILDEDAGIPGIQIALGPFLSPGAVAQNQVDTVAGVIHVAYTQSNATPPQSGSGTVASFRVQAVAVGATPLGMHGTALLDGSLNSIPHSAVGGFVAVDTRVVTGHVYLEGRTQHAGTQIRHGSTLLALTRNDGSFIFASPVGVGENLGLTATHMGYLTATKTLLITADPVVDAGDVILVAGDAAGPRTTVARAGGCPGDPTIVVPGLPDGRVNIIDLAFVSGRFGAAEGDLTWQPSSDGCHPDWFAYRADINGDGVVNILDVVRVANNYGAVGPIPW
ncbi:MAG: hypothetical protein H5T69_02410 [Chloroflexi bacterium]|nr:hypothetical protein [Chloroflexota bacterium]